MFKQEGLASKGVGVAVRAGSSPSLAADMDREGTENRSKSVATRQPRQRAAAVPQAASLERNRETTAP